MLSRRRRGRSAARNRRDRDPICAAELERGGKKRKEVGGYVAGRTEGRRDSSEKERDDERAQGERSRGTGTDLMGGRRERCCCCFGDGSKCAEAFNVESDLSEMNCVRMS